MSVRSLYNEGYNLVVKIGFIDRSLGEATSELKSMLARSKLLNRETSLYNIINFIKKNIKPNDIRVSVSFAGIDWDSPQAWGSFSWPFKTLVRENLANIPGYLILINNPSSIMEKALLLYHGFGIVALDMSSAGKNALKEASKPVAVFLDARRVPKPVAVFIEERRGSGWSGYAVYTAEEISSILNRYGFLPALETYSKHGFTVYKQVLSSVFKTKYQLEEFLKQLEHSLEEKGYVLLRHGKNLSLAKYDVLKLGGR